jgi:hypothetical protein
MNEQVGVGESPESVYGAAGSGVRIPCPYLAALASVSVGGYEEVLGAVGSRE